LALGLRVGLIVPGRERSAHAPSRMMNPMFQLRTAEYVSRQEPTKLSAL
jgi:hypothetical protein